MLIVQIIFIIAVISIPVSVISTFRKRTKQRKESEKLYSQPVSLPPIEATEAVVVSKDCDMLKGNSSRLPTHEIIYFATFLTNSNKTVQYVIPQEIFERISVGQRGTLATVDGRFFDFGDGEPV